MRKTQRWSRKKARIAAAVVSSSDFKRALDARDVEQVRRCLEINRFLVHVDQPLRTGLRVASPPLVYVLRTHSLWRSVADRFVLEVVEIIRILLDYKADVNAIEFFPDGWTALHWAVQCNLVEVVELLIANGADVNSKDNGGHTPLHYAQSVEVARLLIAHGADVNSKSKYGKTPLFDVWTVEVTRLLIEHGADINHRCGSSRTPLFDAKNVEVARLLIERGADVNSKDNDGKTPLSNACYGEVVRLLIAHGANVNSKDNSGRHDWLSLMWMRGHYSSLETLKVLIEHGADLQGEDGIRALHQAAFVGTLEVMELLLDQGIPVNAKATADADGETPLHCAVKRRWVPGVRLLLQRGANVNATDRFGKTPFAYCRWRLPMTLVLWQWRWSDWRVSLYSRVSGRGRT